MEITGTRKDEYKVTHLWGGLLVAFFFCLRISELMAYMPTISRLGCRTETCLSIAIRRSQTDQAKRGVTRTLSQNTTELWHVEEMKELLRGRAIQTSTTALFPPTSFRAKLAQAMKGAVVSNRVPVEAANTQFLRDGGDTALFSVGIDWMAIQRWGRWRSFIFHEYVWRDSVGFAH